MTPKEVLAFIREKDVKAVDMRFMDFPGLWQHFTIPADALSESTFEEGRAHLGLETQRQWSDLAIERTTPLLFGLYSLVILFGHALHPDGQIPITQAAWYRKPAATFCNVLAAVRRSLWGMETFPTSRTHPDVVLVPRSTLERWSVTVC